MPLRTAAYCVLIVLMSCSPAIPGVDGRERALSRSPYEQQEVFRFGIVPAGEAIRHTFTLTNGTRQRAQIVGVQSGCSCTVPEPSKDVLEAFETIPLPATLHTKGKAGRISVSFSCTLDSGMTYRFGFEGFVSPRELRPVRFGPFKRGSEEEREIHLPFPEGDTLEIRSVRRDEALFQVEEGARTDTDLVFLVLPASHIPYGDFESRIEFETNDTLNPVKTAVVSGHVLYPVELESKELALGTVEPDGVLSGIARVYSPYETPFHVTDIRQRKGDPVEWSWSQVGPAVVDVKVDVRGRFSDPAISAELVFETRAAKESFPLTLEVFGLMNHFKE